MNLKEIYSTTDNYDIKAYNLAKPVISFEVFPDENLENLYRELNILKKYKPSLVSLTYGACGKNKPFSVDIIKHLKVNMQFEVMPHFTCICNSRETTRSNLEIIEKLGLQNILALRGDIPEDKSACCSDFKYANELTAYISHQTDLSIAVAGYPEGHIESPDILTDIDNLKRKIDAGASTIFTQLFFDNAKFFTYVQLVRDKGIKVPIIAGIMPIISLKQVEKMTKLAKIEVPKILRERLDLYKNNPDDIVKLGIDFASSQCRQLIDAKTDGLHFFTLNRSHSTSEILKNIL